MPEGGSQDLHVRKMITTSRLASLPLGILCCVLGTQLCQELAGARGTGGGCDGFGMLLLRALPAARRCATGVIKARPRGLLAPESLLAPRLSVLDLLLLVVVVSVLKGQRPAPGFAREWQEAAVRSLRSAGLH